MVFLMSLLHNPLETCLDITSPLSIPIISASMINSDANPGVSTISLIISRMCVISKGLPFLLKAFKLFSSLMIIQRIPSHLS